VLDDEKCRVVREGGDGARGLRVRMLVRGRGGDEVNDGDLGLCLEEDLSRP
jgi:hypothetical protein